MMMTKVERESYFFWVSAAAVPETPTTTKFCSSADGAASSSGLYLFFRSLSLNTFTVSLRANREREKEGMVLT